MQSIMQSRSQKKIWTSLSVYTVAVLVLTFSINEISCEYEVHSIGAHSLNTSPDEAEDPSSMRFARSIKATPLRWGKRNIDKRSTAEDDDGTSEDLVQDRDTRATPLRWGKRMLEDSLLRPARATPLRWGKRSTDSQLYELYNKRAPLRWGKRAPSRFGKRAPMRFGKRAPMRFGKRDQVEDLNDMYQFYPQTELNYQYGTEQ